jgi:hypothetical protein
MENKGKYGGFEDVTYEATGFFRVEGAGRKWRLVDPEGHPFFIIGINHVDAAALKYKENIHIWRGRYGSRGRWIHEGVVKPLKSWGFNTIRPLLDEPWFIGWHWCAYIENPARSDGVKNPWDKPHQDFVEPVSEFNHRVYEFVLEEGQHLVY